jgi:hypothetical protein
MKRKIFLPATIVFVLLFCGQAFAKATNSCDGVDISFDKQAFATQAMQTSLTEAAKNAKANGGTAQEIICASAGIEGLTTADIVSALRNAGFDPVVIRMAAEDTGLDLGEVDIALAPDPGNPAPLPTSLGLTPGKNASPNTP